MLIGVPLALAVAALGMQGLAAMLALGAIVFVSVFLSIMAEPWLVARRRRTQH
jgi:hypothetical protein